MKEKCEIFSLVFTKITFVLFLLIISFSIVVNIEPNCIDCVEEFKKFCEQNQYLKYLFVENTIKTILNFLIPLLSITCSLFIFASNKHKEYTYNLGLTKILGQVFNARFELNITIFLTIFIQIFFATTHCYFSFYLLTVYQIICFSFLLFNVLYKLKDYNSFKKRLLKKFRKQCKNKTVTHEILKNTATNSIMDFSTINTLLLDNFCEFFSCYIVILAKNFKQKKSSTYNLYRSFYKEILSILDVYVNDIYLDAYTKSKILVKILLYLENYISINNKWEEIKCNFFFWTGYVAILSTALDIDNRNIIDYKTSLYGLQNKIHSIFYKIRFTLVKNIFEFQSYFRTRFVSFNMYFYKENEEKEIIKKNTNVEFLRLIWILWAESNNIHVSEIVTPLENLINSIKNTENEYKFNSAYCVINNNRLFYTNTGDSYE